MCRRSSAHDGERAPAALKADTLLRYHGLRWPDVIRLPNDWPGSAPTEPVRSWQEPCGIDHQTAAICLCWQECLTPWEVDFCRSITGRFRPLTSRQREVLARLVAKCRLFATGEYKP
jgi:hypothetical protein